MQICSPAWRLSDVEPMRATEVCLEMRRSRLARRVPLGSGGRGQVRSGAQSGAGVGAVGGPSPDQGGCWPCPQGPARVGALRKERGGKLGREAGLLTTFPWTPSERKPWGKGPREEPLLTRAVGKNKPNFQQFKGSNLNWNVSKQKLYKNTGNE